MAAEENDELKKLVNNLGKAVNHSLSHSPVIRQAVEAIRKNGYEVDLSLAACIGVYKEKNHVASTVCPQELKFEFDQNDVEFLKSINLRLTTD